MENEVKSNKGFLIGLVIAIIVVGLAFGATFYLSKDNNKKAPQPSSTEKRPGELKFSKEVFEIPLSKSAYAGLGEDYRKGGDESSVVITEFSDFECPACANDAKTLREVAEEFKNDILIVYRNYPLDMSCNGGIKQPYHQTSCLSATLARCAGQYGKFWDFHKLAFENREHASPDEAKKWARETGLTDSQIEACLKSASIMDKIKDDISLASKIGIEGTPMILFNGRKYFGPRNLDAYRQEIISLLEKK